MDVMEDEPNTDTNTNTNAKTNTATNDPRQLTKAQQKIYKQYQRLGNKSKARIENERFLKRRSSFNARSFTRRHQLNKITMYEEFVELLTSKSKILNPRNYLDFVAAIVLVYIGSNQSIAIDNRTSNYYLATFKPLVLTNIDQMIPYFAPNDKIAYLIPKSVISQSKKQVLIKEEEQRRARLMADMHSSDDSESEDYIASMAEIGVAEEDHNHNVDDGHHLDEEKLFHSSASACNLDQNRNQNQIDVVIDADAVENNANSDADADVDDDSAAESDRFALQANYAFGVLGDQRLLHSKNSPYVMNSNYEWMVLNHVHITPPPRNETTHALQFVVGAVIISDGVANTYCVYATRTGLYYNDSNVNTDTDTDTDTNTNTSADAKTQSQNNSGLVQLLKQRIIAIWRQNDSVFVLVDGIKVYTILLHKNGLELRIEIIFSCQKEYKSVFNLFDAFIGAYYQSNEQMLYIGTSQARLYAFKNGGLLDTQFHQKYTRFRTNLLNSAAAPEVPKIEKGNLMYFDVDRNCLVYLGTKFVTVVSLNRARNGGYLNLADFAKVYQRNWFLKGINFECKHFLYIYHQKTLVVLKKIRSGAKYPYTLKIYTGKSLRFE